MALAVVVEGVEKESITIVTTTLKGRVTIMELIHQILREPLHLKKYQLLFKLMYGTKQRRINNNDDSDITAILNVLGSTIDTLQDTVSLITDYHIDNGGGNNNNGGNKNGENLHRMSMVVEIIDLIAATLAKIRENVEYFLT